MFDCVEIPEPSISVRKSCGMNRSTAADGSELFLAALVVG